MDRVNIVLLACKSRFYITGVYSSTFYIFPLALVLYII